LTLRHHGNAPWAGHQPAAAYLEVRACEPLRNTTTACKCSEQLGRVHAQCARVSSSCTKARYGFTTTGCSSTLYRAAPDASRFMQANATNAFRCHRVNSRAPNGEAKSPTIRLHYFLLVRLPPFFHHYYRISFPTRAKSLFRGGQRNRLGASVTVNEALTEALCCPPRLIK